MQLGYKIILAAGLLYTFGNNLIGPYYAVFVQELGGDFIIIGQTSALFSVSTGLAIALVGKLSDRMNKELIASLGFVLGAVGTVGYMVISAPWQLFVLQIIFALAVACMTGPLMALTARYIDKGTEGWQWGLDSGSAYIATAASVLVGAYIIDGFGFMTMFVIMLVIEILAAVVMGSLYFANRSKSAAAKPA